MIILICFSCSDSDTETIDTTLFYGRWYSKEKCFTQNYIEFNADGSYINRFSLNENCSMDTFDVKETTNTYQLVGNQIVYGSSSVTRVVIKGTNDTTVSDFIDLEFFAQRIVDITTEELTIETETTISGRNSKRIQKFYRNLD